MKTKTYCLAMVAIALTSAGHLSAQTVTSSFEGVSPGLNVKGMFDGINAQYVNSGVMKFSDFDAFCIDPYQGIVANQPITYNVALTFSTPETDKAISKLVGGYYASGQSALEAAAIQWAIWEVVVDGTNNPSLYSGNNRVFDAATAQLGQKYLSKLSELPEANVIFLTNSRYQDMVTVVPEPSSAALFGLGVVGFLLRRKRA
ncbi:MAG: PEP-CTERM sorting domain-containing protein [Akkermansiaceae bacterium]|nr:PEP-CTERM sorting domain-containing protein [Akkermansiaceae bacterium]